MVGGIRGQVNGSERTHNDLWRPASVTMFHSPELQRTVPNFLETTKWSAILIIGFNSCPPGRLFDLSSVLGWTFGYRWSVNKGHVGFVSQNPKFFRAIHRGFRFNFYTFLVLRDCAVCRKPQCGFLFPAAFSRSGSRSLRANSLRERVRRAGPLVTVRCADRMCSGVRTYLSCLLVHNPAEPQAPGCFKITRKTFTVTLQCASFFVRIVRAAPLRFRAEALYQIPWSERFFCVL
jgi:hypothetical protein